MKFISIIKESVESDLTNLKVANKYIDFVLKHIKNLKYKDWKEFKKTNSYSALIPLFKELPKPLTTHISIKFKKIDYGGMFHISENAISLNIFYPKFGDNLTKTICPFNYDIIKENVEFYLNSNKNTIVHEFTHFLDHLRHKKIQSGTTFILSTKGEMAYYNTPQEYNAFTMALINDLNTKFNSLINKLDKSTSIKNFIYTFGDNDFKKFLKNANPEINRLLLILTDKYRKHFLKRLYLHYQEWMKLWNDKKRDLEDNENQI